MNERQKNLKKTLAILASLVIWPAYMALDLALAIIGVPIVAMLAYTKTWTIAPGGFVGRKIAYWPKWAWLWGNDEDGVIGSYEFQTDHYNWSDSRKAFVWSALRNSVNNLRYVWPIRTMVNKPAGASYAYELFTVTFLWQGFKTYLRIDTDSHYFHIGWRLMEDRLVPVGFAFSGGKS
jgi:hypothetical protein